MNHQIVLERAAASPRLPLGNAGSAIRARSSIVRWVWLGLMLALLMAAPGVTLPPAHAASITVINPNDSGSGSLRQAITDAVAGDTINFNLTYPATIILTSGQLTIGKNLTISGPGAGNLTISGNNASGIFNVTGGVNVTISGVTIANGKAVAGSGINNAGALLVADSTFSGNNASDRGTINNTGTLNLIYCAFSGNSALYGGIHNDGTATVTSSTFTNNNATTGAGIYNDNNGTATVHNSTFTGNSAIYGGGIFNNDYGTLDVNGSTFFNNIAPAGSTYGGGIDTEGPATVTDSTFAGNRATYGGGMGAFGSRGNPTVINSTFSNNSASQGGGIYKDGSAIVTLKNNIVANSPAGGNCFGALAAASTNNLSTDSSCATGFTQVASAQLALGTLTGTPAYYPLNVGSVAIDTGTNAVCPAIDQRGVSRPQDGDGDTVAVCDVGSYEYSTPFVPTNFLYLPLILR